MKKKPIKIEFGSDGNSHLLTALSTVHREVVNIALRGSLTGICPDERYLRLVKDRLSLIVEICDAPEQLQPDGEMPAARDVTTPLASNTD